jgi:hypothetical protein
MLQQQVFWAEGRYRRGLLLGVPPSGRLARLAARAAGRFASERDASEALDARREA